MKMFTKAISFLSRKKLPTICRSLIVARYSSTTAIENKLNRSQFFVVDQESNERLFKVNGWRNDHLTQFDLADEVAILIRKPYLEIVEYLNKTNFSRPINRYVLYGNFGNGKTFTLNHLLLYAHQNDFITVHCPFAVNWVLKPHEIAQSEWKSDRIDTPLEAAMALQNFKNQNFTLINKFNLTTNQAYKWSLRETTEKDEPLMNLIDFGINRIKRASDVYAALLKELKLNANNDKCKVFVVGDLVNLFFHQRSKLKYPDKSLVPPENITLTRSFIKLLKQDWKNGAAVVAVDSTDYFRWDNGKLTGESFGEDLPMNLLTRKGFELLDPFIPVHVPKYTNRETDELIDYYIERGVIQRPEAKKNEGREEIKFLSAFNPLELFKLSASS